MLEIVYNRIMKTIKSIKKRRSIRSYKDWEVSQEHIEDILNCGRLAPSPKNKQPWFFVVVNGSLKDRVANLMIAYALAMDLEKYQREVGFPSSIGPTASIIKEAPVMILIFRAPDKGWEGGDNLAIGACIENMCLRATELGLGTLWIRDIYRTRKEIAELLGHSELELNSALLIGYANENYPKAPRKKLSEIVEWRWED